MIQWACSFQQISDETFVNDENSFYGSLEFCFTYTKISNRRSVYTKTADPDPDARCIPCFRIRQLPVVQIVQSSHPVRLTPMVALLLIVKPFINCKQKRTSQCQHELNNLHIYTKHRSGYLRVGSALLFHKDMSKNRNIRLWHEK